MNIRVTHADLNYYPAMVGEESGVKLGATIRYEPVKASLHDSWEAEFDAASIDWWAYEGTPTIWYAGWSLNANGERDKRQSTRTMRLVGKDAQRLREPAIGDILDPVTFAAAVTDHPVIKALRQASQTITEAVAS